MLEHDKKINKHHLHFSTWFTVNKQSFYYFAYNTIHYCITVLKMRPYLERISNSKLLRA